MESPTGPVRIADLAQPVLTSAQEGALEYAATLDVSLDPAGLMARASEATGLDDFGPAGFEPRLRAWVDAVEGDTGLTALARLIQQRRLHQLLVNRLALAELLTQHPEIHDVEIEAPLIVVGLPRSGTTHLVNLVAADSRRRALPFWESQAPFPLTGDGPGVDGVDPRFTRCARDHAAEQDLAPLTRNMHDRFPAAIEEEVELLDVDFASYSLEWHLRSPAWRDFYLGLDQVEHYRFLETTLKALTFLRGPRQWVLKSPQHLEQLGPLVTTFPDATVAFTHRDPVAVLQSAITMLAYGDRVRRTAIEPEQLAAYWLDRLQRLLDAFSRDRHLVTRSVDVVFHEFMADDLGTVVRLYETAGVELTSRARRQLRAYLDANPRGKHGRVVYDLAGDFGLDPAEVRERFGSYLDHYDIRPEV